MNAEPIEPYRPQATTSASSPRPRSSTATTPRSTSCGASCRRPAPRSSTSATTARSPRSSTARSRRTPRRSRSRRTRAATSSSSSTCTTCCAERGAPHQDLRRRRRHDPAERDRGAPRVRHRPHLLARRRPRAGPAGDDQRPAVRSATSRRSAPPLDGDVSTPAARATTRAIAQLDHAGGERPRGAAGVLTRALEPMLDGRRPSRCSASPAPAARASPRSSTSSCAASCADFADKTIAVLSVDPSQAQDRRRAARRPHPHERDRRPARLHALAGHAAVEPRAVASTSQDVDRHLQGRRLRPDHRRDLRHRPVATPRSSSTRDVSLYVMTAEYGAATQLEKIDMLDFADLDRDQQVRQARRARRAARRAQAVQAQPRALRGRRTTSCRSTARSRRSSTTRARTRSTGR